jgi:hypothetical protein
MKTTIFKSENLEVFYQIGTNPKNGEAKAIKVSCKAVNPFDGKTYEKYAGWLGITLTLHGGVETPGYIFNTACKLIAKHKDEILPAVIAFLNQKGHVRRANEFKVCDASGAGRGVESKIVYPALTYKKV